MSDAPARRCGRCGCEHRWGACPRCLGRRHVWEGSSAEGQVCRICGVKRSTFRKRMKGDKGSSWKRAYDDRVGPAPLCGELF